jgi:hypothetical protein
MLDGKSKRTIEDLVTSIGRQVAKINEDKETISSVKRVSGNPDNINDFQRAIAKMAEAEEALRVAKSRLQNLM